MTTTAEQECYGMYSADFARRVWAKRRREAAKAAAGAEKRRQEMEASRDTGQLSAASPSVRKIIEEIAGKHGASAESVMGPKRYPWLAAIRHEAMFEVAKRRPDLSTAQIGREFGRDHTTVLHALRKHGMEYRSLEQRRAAMEVGS